MEKDSIQKLIKLHNSLREQESVNNANINDFFQGLRNLLETRLDLQEEVWVDFEINPAMRHEPVNIFGWGHTDSGWHVAVAQREEHRHSESEPVEVYGDTPKKGILDCSSSEKWIVFSNIDLLFAEIQNHLTQRLRSEREIAEKINSRLELLEKLLES